MMVDRYNLVRVPVIMEQGVMLMYNFEFYAPTRVVFGRGTESQAGALVKEYGGTSVLIHYGGGRGGPSGPVPRHTEAVPSVLA